MPLLVGVGALVILLLGGGAFAVNSLRAQPRASPSPTASTPRSSVASSVAPTKAATSPSPAATPSPTGSGAPVPPDSTAACPTSTSTGTKITDGYLTLTAPEKWTNGSRPEWTNCGGSTLRLNTAGDWRSFVQLGAVGNPAGDLKALGMRVWDYVTTHSFDGAHTRTQLTISKPGTLAGRKTWDIYGRVYTKGTEYNMVRIELVDRPDGNASVAVSSWPANEAFDDADIQLALATLKTD
ncbi:MAG: hypothetical protein WAV45_02250 [Propionibacteriaceae bacterium]